MSVQKPSKNPNYLKRSKKPFEMIYRLVLDKLCNANALAVYCHLSSKPDRWEINEKYLMNHFKWGRDKTRDALNCLIVNKLMSRKQLINVKGHFIGRVTELLDGYDFTQYVEYNKNVHKKLCEYEEVIHNESRPSPDLPSTDKPVDGKQVAIEEDIKAFKKEDKKHKREEIRKERVTHSKKSYCPGSDDLIISDIAMELAKQKNIDLNKTIFKFKEYAKSCGWLREDWRAAFVKWILDEKIHSKSYSPVKNNPNETKSIVNWFDGYAH